MDKKLIDYKKIFIYIYPLFFYNFYNYAYINTQIVKFCYLLISLIGLIIFFNEFAFKANGYFLKNIRWLVFLILFSMLNSYVFWDQNLLLSYKTTAYYLGLIYFFVLLKYNPNLIFIERLIWFYCFLFILLWCYAFANAPKVIFGWDIDKELTDDRGIYRMGLYGSGALILGFFLSVNKYIDTKKGKWIVMFCFLFFFIILQVTRQVIIFSFLVAFIYLSKNNLKLFFVTIILFLIIGTYFSNMSVGENSVIGRLINQSENQIVNNKLGEEDIRLREYEYYLFKYPNNFYTSLFGNGVPIPESDLGKLELNNTINKSFYVSDVGYAEIFIRIGIVGLFLYLWILYKSIKLKVLRQSMFAKLFIIYIFMANLMSHPIIIDAISLAISLYVLEYNFLRNNLKSKLKLVT